MIKERMGTRDNPNKRGYFTITGDTPEDFKKIKGSQLLKKIHRQGQDAKLKRVATLVSEGRETVVFPSGKKAEYTPPEAEYARSTIRALGKKVPATKITFQMGARIITKPDGTKAVVRDED